MEDLLYRFLAFYKRLPVPLKNLFGGIYYALPRRWKYGSFYKCYMDRIGQFYSFATLEQTLKAQEELLVAQVEKAIRCIPYYRDYEMVRSMKDFRRLPVIDKSIVKENMDRMCNPDLKKKGIVSNTGGSSGTPMEFFLEKYISRPKEKAHFDWYWGQFDYRPGERILMVRGTPLKGNRTCEYNTIGNTLRISCYHLNEDTVVPVIIHVNRFRPRFIHAYPSSLKILTTLLDQSREQINLDIQAIFLGSEQLPESYRHYFEQFYRARIVNWYGHSERLIHGGNCPLSEEYHFYPFYGFTELLDEENQPVDRPGDEGRIVATGFDNAVMPLIRYDTGDTGILSDKAECPCGFRGTSLKRITGRGQDIIVLSDGTKVTLTAFIFGQHLDAFREIREMQLIQEKAGVIEIRIVANESFDEKLQKGMVDTLLKSVGHKLEIRLRMVDDLPKTSRGKHRFLISRLSPAEYQNGEP